MFVSLCNCIFPPARAPIPKRTFLIVHRLITYISGFLCSSNMTSHDIFIDTSPSKTYCVTGNFFFGNTSGNQEKCHFLMLGDVISTSHTQELLQCCSFSRSLLRDSDGFRLSCAAAVHTCNNTCSVGGPAAVTSHMSDP